MGLGVGGTKSENKATVGGGTKSIGQQIIANFGGNTSDFPFT